MNKSDINKYLKSIKKELLISQGIKHAYISELKIRINEFLHQHGELTFDILCKEFGSPKEIADSFFDKEDIDALKKKAKRYNIIKWLVTVLSIALVLSIIFMIIIIASDEDGYYKTYITYVLPFISKAL